MARTKLTETVADYNGANPETNAQVCTTKGAFQFEIASATGKSQILQVSNGSAATIYFEPLTEYSVESRYPLDDIVYTLAAGDLRIFSEFTIATFGKLEDATTPADSTKNWMRFNIYTGNKITAGGTIVNGSQYVVLDQNGVTGGLVLNSGTYKEGESWTANSTDVTAFAALSNGIVVAKAAGADVAVMLLKTP